MGSWLIGRLTSPANGRDGEAGGARVRAAPIHRNEKALCRRPCEVGENCVVGGPGGAAVQPGAAEQLASAQRHGGGCGPYL